MKVVFIIRRTNQFKYYGGLVKESIKKKIKIELWFYIIDEKNNNKKYLNCLNLKNKFIKKIKKRYFFSSLEISDYIVKNSNNINFFISYDFVMSRDFIITETFTNSIKLKWCVIMHGMDSFANLKYVNNFQLYLKDFYFFYSSKYMLNHGIKWLEKFLPKVVNPFLKNKKNFFEVGNLMLDNSYRPIIKKKKINLFTISVSSI